MPADGDVRKKEGELLKYKNYFSGWGKRYFRLERSYLHYFETKHSHQPIATVTRGEISEVKPSTSWADRENVFEIVQKNGVIWYCQAKSPEEMVSWLQALSTVPFLLDTSKYPTVPMGEAPSVINDQDGSCQPTAPPAYNDSLYRPLIEQAHHTAYVNNTPHDCVHHHNSPPPPYTNQNAPHSRHQHPHQPPTS